MLSPEGGEESKHKKSGLVLRLREDESMRTFLRDLLNLNSQIVTQKPSSTLRLIRRALKGRYATHVRKCLVDRDLKSLLCILSIVADSDERDDEEPNEYYPKPVQDESLSDLGLHPVGAKLGDEEEEDEVQGTTDSSGKDDLILTVLTDGEPETLLRSSANEPRGQSQEDEIEVDQLSGLSGMYHTIADQLDLLPQPQDNSQESSPKSSNISKALNWSPSDAGSCINLSQGSSNVFASSGADVSHIALQGDSENSQLSDGKSYADAGAQHFQHNIEIEMISSKSSSISTKTHLSKQLSMKQLKPTPRFKSQEVSILSFSQHSTLESNLRHFYRKVMDSFIKNPNILTYWKHILQKHPELYNIIFLKSEPEMVSLHNPFYPSGGFVYFVKLIKKLQELMRLRFLSSASDEHEKIRRIQQISSQINVLTTKCEKLLPILMNIKAHGESESLKRSKEIHELETLLKQQFEDNKSRIYEEAKRLEKSKLVAKKIHETKREAKSLDAEAWEKRLDDTLMTLHQGYQGLTSYRKKLEGEVRGVIEEYDVRVSELQKIVDELTFEETRNEGIILALQSEYKVIEERYEEMRATKRLRQLLKSLEMAESVKHNWAARRIQDAWRRYKAMKYRRRRLRVGKKKKGTSGVSKPKPGSKK